MCNKRKLCETECDDCIKRSFAAFENEEILAMWSEDNVLLPHQVVINSSKKFLFDCIGCGHQISHYLNKMMKKLHWCNYCGREQICGKKDCEFCFVITFAYLCPDRAQYVVPESELQPWEVTAYSHCNLLFQCIICPHEFLCNPKDIMINGRWCPFCTDKQLCKDQDCNYCFVKSMASLEPIKLASWIRKPDDPDPRDIFLGTKKMFTFQCKECGDIFTKTLYQIGIKNTWCTLCTNKTEKKIYEHLISIFRKDDIIRGAAFDWCRNPVTNRHLPFDFVIKSLMKIIECDGDHHFIDLPYYNNSDHGQKQERDLYKIKMAKENGYSMVRLYQRRIS
uniref:Treble clef zinc finger domain-containing protein n=1 Tax=viral metagenome TaxID=1070528 RepID=A0A6C0JUD1_9ZZZZ